MEIRSHIYCPNCQFAYCHHTPDGLLQCTQCGHTWQKAQQELAKHVTYQNGEVKEVNPSEGAD
ncbi:hypothetical protein ACM67B_03805 [Neisseria sp. CCUG17229]|uniref:hypothetical protein n=1 Tax=Neisseria sp. CCUG17229 TaxID=3392036 RepID=UPI003A101EC9